VSANQVVFVQGLRDTRGALSRWNARPAPVLREWFAGALAVACALLFSVWAVASLTQPDATPLGIPGLNTTAHPGDVASILLRNSLVLALHATACVAGFIAGSSLALSAERRSGLSR
jgi:ABC-type enterobactin transport system permease subunit